MREEPFHFPSSEAISWRLVGLDLWQEGEVAWPRLPAGLARNARRLWFRFSFGWVLLGSAWPAGEEGRSLQLRQSRPAPKVCTGENHFRLVDSKFRCGWLFAYRASVLLGFPQRHCSSQCWDGEDGAGWWLLGLIGLVFIYLLLSPRLYVVVCADAVAYPGFGVQQIQLRTEDSEDGDLGAVAP